MRRPAVGSPAVLVLTASLALGAFSTSTGASPGKGHEDGRTRVAKVAVSGAYIPQPVMDDMAAGYFTVTNTGDRDDRLTAVTSDLSSDITMHTSQDNRMRRVDSFTVPAGGKLTLSNGGNHLMLMNLTRKPVAGDRVSLVLHFAQSGPIGIQVPVEPTSYRPKT